MKALLKSIVLIGKGAGRSFLEYPAAMASGLLFTLVTLVRIKMDWPAQEIYNNLLSALHLSLGLGGIFALAAIALAKSRSSTRQSFIAANAVSAVVVVGTFLTLYYLSGISDIAVTRVIVAAFISLLAFILVGAYPKEESDFASSLFMVHKAFFIALLYELVMYAGGSAVAGAIKGLLYRDMSSRVFMYIGALTAFLAYAIFIGHFPDFAKKRVVQRQPKFIQVLFDYIMVPLLLALTGVLLIWSVKTALGSSDTSFMVLYSVAAGYGVIGLWLYIMVTHSQAKTAIFYRQIYPFAALVILAFEARALFVQMDKWGLKTAEYWFGIILIVSVIAAIVLIIKKEKAYTAIVVVIMTAAIFSALPWLGYQDLPVSLQSARMEKILIKEGMLSGNKIIHSSHEIDKATREVITDGITFLQRSESSKKPAWLEDKFGEYIYFKEVFGFEQTWPESEGSQDIYEGTYFMLSGGHVDIKDYKWAIHLSNDGIKSSAFVEGEKGNYTIIFDNSSAGKSPSLIIERDGKVVLREGLDSYLDELMAKYYSKSKVGSETKIEEMSVEFENQDIKALLLVNYVSINTNTISGKIEYYTDANMVFLEEK